jgi:hypothetical protein
VGRLKTPVVATWLLERFAVNDSIVGDLLERYEKGQSSIWYLRQVLMTILVGAVREIQDHKLLVVRAVAMGFSILVLFDLGTSTLLNGVSFHGAVWIFGHLFQPGQWLKVPIWYSRFSSAVPSAVGSSAVSVAHIEAR